MSPSPPRVTGEPLKLVDRLLRWRRIRAALPFIPTASKVLDVGCHDGALFRALGRRAVSGVGLDPLLERSEDAGRFRYIDAPFPAPGLSDGGFDVITFLAVLEHVDDAELVTMAKECERLLAPNGLVIVTVPSPRVDTILRWLARARLVVGIAAHEHHGLDPEAIPQAFTGPRLLLTHRRRFEFGLNNLFVFRARP